MKSYRGIQKAKGPLVFLDAVPEAMAGELLRLHVPGEPDRLAEIIRLEEKYSIAQVYEGTEGLDTDRVFTEYTGSPLRVPLGPDMLGRTFNGIGEATEDGPYFGAESRDINGLPLNPMARLYPRNYINTGISAIDILMTLIRGQKLPVFSGQGLPHRELAAQIVSQASLKESDEPFVVVFAAIGAQRGDVQFFDEAFRSSGAAEHLVCYYNYAQDPVAERLTCPRCALTAAEYLAFDLGYNVLVVLTDITAYCEGLREISSARDEVPGRKGYPGYLYSNLASLYERAGILADGKGSVTMLPILTMPGDDISHPIPDLTGYITEGQIVLGRDLNSKNIYPPIEVLPSLSRLMKDGIGEGFTREDHSDLANQLFSSYALVEDVRNLAQIMGKDELSDRDRAILRFGEAFERDFLSQSTNENRSLEESLTRGWQILALLPDAALDRLSKERIEKMIVRDARNPYWMKHRSEA